MVFHKEILKVSSVSIRLKLSRPTNTMGLAESHSIKPKTMEKIIGISVKAKKPKKFGSKNKYAVTLFLRARLFIMSAKKHSLLLLKKKGQTQDRR